MAKKVLLIATGGTIACINTPEGLKPALTPEQIVSYFPEKEGINLDVLALMNKDSTNMQPEDWQLMATTIDSKINDYNSFVVTHGTDTLAYTSSALSFMLMGINKPVIITGAQKSIQDSPTDAVTNLTNAMIAAGRNITGVYVAFDRKLIRGCHASKVKSRSFDAFASINEGVAGYFFDGALNTAKQKGLSIPYKMDTTLDTNVCFVKLSPGFRPGTLDALYNSGYTGFVIEAYGLGGIPFEKRDISLDIQNLVSRQVPIVVTTQCTYEGVDLSQYEVGLKAAAAGAIPAFNMTKEAAITKLMWVMGHAKNLGDIRKEMLTNYCGELSD